MKANKLMVGDFVKVNRDVCIKNGTIVEIRAIDADNAFIEKGLKGCATCVNINDHCEFGGVWVDFLEPIPLTPEILEKNGFHINGIPNSITSVKAIDDWSDDTYVWSRQETPDERMFVSVYIDDPANFFVEVYCQYCHVDGIHVKYLHQLQHALKLCGINKEIVL